MKRLSRSERKTAIFNALNQYEIALTAGELAARMNLTASPYFRELLSEMRAEGWIFMTVIRWSNGTLAYVYSTFDPANPPVHE